MRGNFHIGVLGQRDYDVAKGDQHYIKIHA